MSKTEADAMVAFLQVVIAGLVTGSLHGLLTLGIVLITGVLNFAYGAIAALCACFMYFLLTGPYLNFWLALFLTLLFAPLLGIMLERGFARPVLHSLSCHDCCGRTGFTDRIGPRCDLCRFSPAAIGSFAQSPDGWLSPSADLNPDYRYLWTIATARLDFLSQWLE